MNYIDNQLKHKEYIEITTRPSKWIFFNSFLNLLYSIIIMVLLLGTGHEYLSYIVLIIGTYFILYDVIRYFTTEIAVTNQRILYKTGFIVRYTNEIPITKIENIKLNQNLIERILNFGRIEIIGTGTTDLTIDYIPEPLHFKSFI